jgi:hypothetical protein
MGIILKTKEIGILFEVQHCPISIYSAVSHLSLHYINWAYYENLDATSSAAIEMLSFANGRLINN